MKVRSEFAAGKSFHMDLSEVIDLAVNPAQGKAATSPEVLAKQFDELAHVVSLLLDVMPAAMRKAAVGSLLVRTHLTLQE